jgi:hypothetical protein
MKTLSEIASVLRSKNAGPLQLTFDIIFPDRDIFQLVKNSGALDPVQIGLLYGSDPARISIIYYDIVHAAKITMPRRCASGDLKDDDIYGCQQHVPLMGIPVIE